MSQLHVTNGSVFADRLGELGMKGDRLSWIDVLHEGPVTATPMHMLVHLRAYFISQEQWAGYYEAMAGLLERSDKLMNHFKARQEVVLWFEDDLFDQLQLIQILHEFAACGQPPDHATIVQTDRNLMSYTDDDLRLHFEQRIPVTAAMLQQAETAWDAFTDMMPQKLNASQSLHFEDLPYVKETLLRLMQEYPSKHNGLSRTEQRILQILQQGHTKPFEIFNQLQATEPRPFLGDSVFITILRRMMSEDYGLIQSQRSLEDDPVFELWRRDLALTTRAELLLDGELSLLEYATINRWVGGVQLMDKQGAWVWNEETEQIEEMKI